MLNILTICTGNVCRSPLAAIELATELRRNGVTVSSAGTRARPGVAPPPELLESASDWRIDLALLASHRSQRVTPELLSGADLILAMTRNHRREVVEMLPTALRRCFTVREFCRLFDRDRVEGLLTNSRVEPRSPVHDLQVVLDHLIASRGTSAPFDPALDDVVDPYGRSLATYRRSAAEMQPGLKAVAELVQLLERESTARRS